MGEAKRRQKAGITAIPSRLSVVVPPYDKLDCAGYEAKVKAIVSAHSETLIEIAMRSRFQLEGANFMQDLLMTISNSSDGFTIRFEPRDSAIHRREQILLGVSVNLPLSPYLGEIESQLGADQFVVLHLDRVPGAMIPRIFKVSESNIAKICRGTKLSKQRCRATDHEKA